MVNAARSYECPACGGSVDERARACRYCGIALATVRCAVCFHMNVADALHCSGCGAELGLEPITEQSGLPCPACRVPFDQYAGDTGLLFDCTRCGGQFVEHSLLRDLLERQRVYDLKAQRCAPGASTCEPVVYRPCPVCQSMMNRQNFGRSSGVVVDTCSRHGVWFGPGELPRVIEFVRSGGLARAEQAERQERLQGTRQAALTVPEPLDSRIFFDPDLNPLDGLAEAVRGLLKFLARR